ncbi:MFS transporter [Kineosporia sp. R_H_3]|uniref:MFS transporter n=1 Tax=Kineosporia sp. R_H_3 TaxID=1961848 RepID=UPI000B4ABB2A|nr:MFS transporter [Kineosporia sp. R_H_3]
MSFQTSARAASSPKAVVAALATASFLQWTGAAAVLPLLPLFLKDRGSSEGLIGAVMAAYFVGAFVAQYLAGRLSDRIGHRTVLLVGLVGYAVASFGFLLDVSGPGYLVLRGLQGAFAGGAQVAMLALVARSVRVDLRGRAFAAVYGGELAGVAIGPILGTAVGLRNMAELFVVSSLGALLAGVPVLLARLRPTGAAEAADAAAARLDWTGWRGRVLVGVLVAAVVGGVLTGVYDATWTLLLDHRGAVEWQIGLSWTLWAIPFVVVTPLAGWLADHHDRRVLVIGAIGSSIFFAALYPFISSLPWLIGLGALESVGVAMAMPAAQSLLAQAAPEAGAGRAMGLFASIQTAAIAASAAVSGALFAIAPWVPFVAVAVVSALLAAALPVVWRGVQGRVPRPVAPVADGVTEDRRPVAVLADERLAG